MPSPPFRSIAGDITDSDGKKWFSHEGAPYVASPAIAGDYLFFTKGEAGILFCVNATTGDEVYGKRRLPLAGSPIRRPLSPKTEYILRIGTGRRL